MLRHTDRTSFLRLLGGFALAAALTACGTAGSLDEVPVSEVPVSEVPVSEVPVSDVPVSATESASGSGSGGAAGMCEAGVPDCGLGAADEFPVEASREAARALVGTAEAELPDTVRVARRGAEQKPLTEDYVLGRLTVALDPAEDGRHVVTEVTVELPDGPETFSAEG